MTYDPKTKQKQIEINRKQTAHETKSIKNGAANDRKQLRQKRRKRSTTAQKTIETVLKRSKTQPKRSKTVPK